MAGLVEWATKHPLVSSPLIIYVLRVGIVFAATQLFRAFFKDEFLKAGTEFCFIGLAVLVGAGFDKSSWFSNSFKDKMFVATIVYTTFYVICYGICFKSYQYLQSTQSPSLREAPKIWFKWWGALALSHGLGLLAVMSAWGPPKGGG